MAFDLKFLGHSAFEIKVGDNYILIDPFFVAYPNYDWKNLNITDIFVTHGHADHLGSSIEISKSKGSLISAIFELGNYCIQKGANANPLSLGGWINYEWGKAMFLPAFHSSSTSESFYAGSPCGILFEINGVKVFHAGDTCLNQEFKTLKEVYKPDIALLPIGGHFTMDIDSATIASDWIGANVVIPIHYNTFPVINADVQKFKSQVENLGKNCLVLNIGESISF